MSSSEKPGSQDSKQNAEESSDSRVRDKDRRRPRRATLAAPIGSDPEPHDPPLEPRNNNENDDRLNADRPPHWG